MYLFIIIIRNLCDTNDEGKLNKDQFILGMYLIDQTVAGKPLPTQLPSQLIPLFSFQKPLQ
jgi:hypothetical protein